MSLAMMVFMAAPLLAPALGQVLIILSNWHMLFIVVAAIGIAALIWAMLRMPESLITERRRPLSLRALLEGYGMIFQQRRAWGYMVASGFTFGCLFAFISASNQILLIRYHVGALFPLAFAAVACGMIVSNFTNARLVERLGMRALSHTALALFCMVNLVHAGFAAIGFQPFWLFVVLVSMMIGLLGFLGANFTALSLEPVGQIAGLASSLQGFISTGVAGVLGGLVGLQFDGTARPFAYGIAALSLAALACVAVTERGQMRWFHWRGEGETEPSINVVKP
jgi:MFS transporter, DHA1 family, multidrug resistance protein